MYQFESYALVVDDDPVVLQLTVRALMREGFFCDEARDGEDAQKYLENSKYDVVVTDLSMPNRHGHALAIDCLALKPAPVVIVLTGVIESRLTKDLLRRGVALVDYKPVQYAAFAGRVKALTVSRRVSASGSPRVSPFSPSEQTCDTQDLMPGAPSVSELEVNLALVARLMPISKASMDVFELTQGNSCGAVEIGAAIQRDPALAAEVLGLANSVFYNTAGDKISEPHHAVVRIGQKRIGEIALASSALLSVTRETLAWLRIDLMWRRSIGAGLAVELLVEQGHHEAKAEGLLMAALLHAHGRIILGSIYPDRYDDMLTKCSVSLATLAEEERKWFPESQARVLSKLLEKWNLPCVVNTPLKSLDESFTVLERLAEPEKTRALLVKTAIVVSRIAATQWEPWDEVELPSHSVLRHLRIHDIESIIQQTRSDTEKVMRYRSNVGDDHDSVHSATKGSLFPQFHYRSLSGGQDDLLVHVLRSFGQVVSDEVDSASTVIGALGINRLSAPPGLYADNAQHDLIITDRKHAAAFSSAGSVIGLPCSFERLRQSVCRAREPCPFVSISGNETQSVDCSA